jgi:hypothetical protein
MMKKIELVSDPPAQVLSLLFLKSVKPGEVVIREIRMRDSLKDCHGKHYANPC